jgi:hypothetical protein
MIDADGDRYHLTIPLSDAVSFAVGICDLGYSEPKDELRQVVGLIALDMLEYSEQWRAAGLLRRSLKLKWPELLA